MNTDLKKAIKDLKSKCKCADFDSLIEKVLLLKEEELKRNSIVYVPKKEDMKVIEQSAYTLTKTEDAIVYHINGLDMVIRPNLGIYESPYSYLFELSEDYENLDEANKEIYENLLFPCTLIPQIPTFAFNLNKKTEEPELLIKLLKVINDYLHESIEESSVIEETSDDLEKNEKFERDEILRETLKSE